MELAAIQKAVGDRYEVLRTVGEGELGTVVEARDTKLDQRVAIKVLKDPLEKTAQTSLSREIDAISQSSHPHLMPILDLVIPDAGSPYLVMEFVEGGSLQDVIQMGVATSPTVAVKLIRQVAEALATIHARGSVHGAVKPSNILLGDGTKRILLTDCGLTLRGPEPVAAEQELSASMVRYASPTRLKGPSNDPRDDLYSLGITLYELLTGNSPFEGRKPFDDVPSARAVNPDIPEKLDAIITRALQPDADDRFQTADELIRALNKTTAPRPANALARKGRLDLLLVTFLALSVGLIVFYAFNTRPEWWQIILFSFGLATAVVGLGALVEFVRRR